MLRLYCHALSVLVFGSIAWITSASVVLVGNGSLFGSCIGSTNVQLSGWLRLQPLPATLQSCVTRVNTGGFPKKACAVWPDRWSKNNPAPVRITHVSRTRQAMPRRGAKLFQSP